MSISSSSASGHPVQAPPSPNTKARDPTKVPRVPESAPISAEEQRIIDNMHKNEGARITKYNISVLTMLRFIRGYVADVRPAEKAQEMFKAMLDWRDEINITKLCSTPHPRAADFQKLWVSGLHGMTRDGHPIYAERVGLIEPSKLLKLFTPEEILQFHIRMMERITAEKEALAARTGRQLYKQLVILDLKGLGLSHLSSTFRAHLKTAIGIDQNYYPETLYKLFITNAGILLKGAWALASPFLDPITKTHIFFGTDHIDKYVDPSQLPRFLGGKCKCKDGKCLIEPFVPGDEAPGTASSAPGLSTPRSSLGAPTAASPVSAPGQRTTSMSKDNKEEEKRRQSGAAAAHGSVGVNGPTASGAYSGGSAGGGTATTDRGRGVSKDESTGLAIHEDGETDGKARSGSGSAQQQAHT